MGFVTAGLFAFNQQGVEGSVLQMVSHGVITGALFMMVGFFYDRTHTRMISDYGGMAKPMPVAAAFFRLFVLGSLGLPGLSGFVGEFLVLVGAFQYAKVFAVLISIGVVLGAAYLLWMYQRTMFQQANEKWASLKDLGAREIVTLVPLVALAVWIGVYPHTFLNLLHAPVEYLISQVQPYLADGGGGLGGLSIDFDIAWRQSRYDKEGPGGDKAAYVNCPMDQAQYEAFVAALLAGAKTEFREWEKNTPYFEGCLPIEVMAERGVDTLRFGPMKPVGLMDPRIGKRPHAVVQLRQDNKLRTLFNMVGFQTKLKYGAQEEIFRMIPGLQNARFARLGGIHRNTFLNSTRLLDATLRLKAEPRVRFAGQVTGVEGYVESAAMGLLAGRFAAAERLGRTLEPPPATTALGALLAHVTGGHLADGKGSFQPMNVNFGLFPPIEAPTHGADGKRLKGEDRSRAKKRAMAERALGDVDTWLGAA